MLHDFFQKQGISAYNAIPLSLCTITKERLLLPHAQSVLLFLVPYFTGEYPNRNVSFYAIPPDYHVYFQQLFAELLPVLQEDYPSYCFQGFTDHSPIAEVRAAAIAQLGCIGDNALLINEKYGSYVFIGEVVSDMPVEKYAFQKPYGRMTPCLHCGKCRKNCPSPAQCLSEITQIKGELSLEQQDIIRKNGTVWGCDFCQESCPLQTREKTPILFFQQNLLPHLTLDQLQQMPEDEFQRRAYAWRKRPCITRNLCLMGEEDLTQNAL